MLYRGSWETFLMLWYFIRVVSRYIHRFISRAWAHLAGRRGSGDDGDDGGRPAARGAVALATYGAIGGAAEAAGRPAAGLGEIMQLGVGGNEALEDI
eukprot:g9021.t1